MSTTLFFLVPIGLAAVVWSLCFVGVCFPTQGLASPYSDTIIAEASQNGLVAYWALSDLIGPPLNMPAQTSGATDLSGNHHDGTYIIPPPYPTMPANSTPIANPSVGRGASIVPGDAGSTKNPFPASADFEGGYVSIPWSTQNSPQLPDLTVEAWIKPNWTAATTGFLWGVFGAISSTGGIAVFIDENNQWRITIGNGTTLVELPSTGVPLDLSSGNPTYVAVTCDKTGTINLWINPQSMGDTPNPPPPSPAWTLQNSGYVPVDPTQPVTFFIGAGDSNDAQTLRTQPMGTGAPLYPFKGQIQSVALYSSVLGPTDVQNHFINGMD
jgi:hypothetical protein